MLDEYLNNDRRGVLPHNACRFDELTFIINLLDGSKEFYTPDELKKIILIEEIKADVFKTYHNGMHENLSSINYYNDQFLDSNLATNNVQLYRDFSNSPEEYFDEFYNMEYSKTPAGRTSKFKKNWDEYARDYHNLLSYMGILPAYFKGEPRRQRESVLFVTPLLKILQKDNELIPEQLLKVKFINSVVDVKSTPRYNRSTRPYYLYLKFLKELKNYGITQVSRDICGAVALCVKKENELNEIVDLIKNKLLNNPRTRLKDLISHDSAFNKEVGRFNTTLNTLVGYGLVDRLNSNGEVNSEGSILSITNKGEKLLSNQSGKIITIQNDIGKFKLTPIVGYIFKKIENLCSNDVKNITLESFICDDSHLKAFVASDVVEQILLAINQDEDLNPIEFISNTELQINDLEEQIYINPYTDFYNLESGNLVNGILPVKIDDRSIEIQEIIQDSVFDNLIEKCRAASKQSDGAIYEDSISDILDYLLGDERVTRYGSHYTGIPISDIAWEVPILVNYRVKKLLIIFEAKASGAISSFSDRDAVPQVDNTIDLKVGDRSEYAGFWYIVVNGQSLPGSNSIHGGARGRRFATPFPAKLNNIWRAIINKYNAQFKVSAMNNLSFTRYMMYLHRRLNSLEINENFTINTTTIPEFWDWGNIFYPTENFVDILNYSDEDMSNLLGD